MTRSNTMTAVDQIPEKGDPIVAKAKRPAWPDAGSGTRRVFFTLLFLIGIAALWRLVSFVLGGRFNVDEFENIQMLWLWERGVIPYRDYLHSHTPAFNVLLWPVYRAVGARPEAVEAVRVAILPVVLATVALVFAVARRVAGTLGAIVATVLFVASPWAVQSLGEARPDTVTFPLLLAAVLLFFRAAGDREWKSARFYGAGAILGLSTIFTMKNGLYALAIAAGFEHLRYARFGADLRRRMIAMTIFGLLVVGPYALFVAALVATGVVRFDAIDAVVTQSFGHLDPNMMKPKHWALLTVFFVGHAFVIFTGVVGAWRARIWREAGADADRLVDSFAGRVLVLALAPLVIMNFAVPHMYLAGLAFAAIFAARLFVEMPRRRAVFWLFFALVPPQLATMADLTTREGQMAEFQYVRDHTPEEAPVIDNMYGYGTFRPIIGRFIHFRAGVLLPEDVEEQNALVLRAILTRRAGAVMRDHLSNLQPDIIFNAIDRCYRPSDEFPDRILLPRPADDPLCPPRAKRR